MMKSRLRTGLEILSLGLAMLGAGCSESNPSGPGPYKGTEMIIVAVKDTINGVYIDRLMTINPNDSLNMTPRYILDSMHLATSPSAGKMAFLLETQSDKDDDFRVFVADIDGKNVREIAGTDAIDRAISFPVLSPDGKSVVYSTLDNRLVMQRVDGTEITILSTNAAFETIPDFDASGNRLAFYGDDGGLYVINSDGNGLRMVADSARSDPEGQSRVEWSPDGTKLLYVGLDGRGQPDIYVVNADGTGERRLTNDLDNDLLPTWSPDGSQIAWAGYPGDIYVMNADGTNRRNITPNVANIDTYPEWSPDGKRLIFVDHYPGVEVGTLRMYDFRSGETTSIAFKVTRAFWGKF